MGILNHPRIKEISIEECGEELVELSADDFELEPMYYKWKFSDTEKIELRSGALDRLRKAKEILNNIEGCEDWNFKIWDTFRTVKTQGLLYKDYEKRLKDNDPSLSDENLADLVQVFVSFPSRDPNYPAPHNTGGAVDLTLVDGYGKEVQMGTAFDEFVGASHTDHFADRDLTWHENRMLLKKVMEEAGFSNYHEEWWHFSYGDQAWALNTGKSIAIYGSKEI
mgnify:CR=1 FL=1|jgi:zinc D-Ala-D-Ala dipeptidase